MLLKKQTETKNKKYRVIFIMLISKNIFHFFEQHDIIINERSNYISFVNFSFVHLE